MDPKANLAEQARLSAEIITLPGLLQLDQARRCSIMNYKAPTEREMRAFARKITVVVNHLLTMRIIHARVKEQIDAECLRILASGEYRYADKWYEHMGDDRLPDDRILRDVKDTYLMHEEDSPRYYKLRADFVESAGWQCPRDYCPASMAESRCIEYENEIISELSALMECPAIKDAWGEHREQSLELSIGLVVGLSSYRKPPMPTEWLGKSL